MRQFLITNFVAKFFKSRELITESQWLGSRKGVMHVRGGG